MLANWPHRSSALPLKVPALTYLTRDEWSLDPSFSSAVVFASLTSAPALFATLLGTLSGATTSTGAGACVGSALINQTVVLAAAVWTAVATSETGRGGGAFEVEALGGAVVVMAVDPAPVLRDLFFCGVSVGALLCVVADGDVSALESLVLLVLCE